MIIKKMTAVFGGLDNETLELHEGLNVIAAPNESGKSTWCAFLRAMLYGIDSSQREKGGVKPDKVRYAPWSGKPMSGEMEIEADGKAITLSRSSRSAASPLKVFSACYTGTAQKIDTLTGTDAGQTLTGMSRTVFDSSVFVRQAGLGVANSAELEKRIGSIVSTGEEQSDSYTAADETLRAWLRKRKHNRSGAIPALDGEIAAREARLSDMDSAARQRAELESRLNASRRREKALESAALREAEEGRGERLRRVAALRAALSEAEKDSAQAREKALQAKSACSGGVFAGKSAEEALKDASDSAETLRGLRAAVPALWPALLAGVLALAALIATLALRLPWLYAVAGVLFLAGAALSGLRNGKQKECRGFEKAMRERYGSDDPDRITALGEEYAENSHRALSAENAARRAEARAQAAREALSRAEEELLSAGDGAAGPSQADLARARAETALLERQLAQAEGRLEAMGDPLVLGTELRARWEERARLQEQYDALALAISTLREANDELQQRFSPRLSALAGDYMSRLTGGKYSRLVFDRDLNALARPSGDPMDRELAYLSAGTADQLYLALRLAICTLALPEGTSCPLILDDALVNFDDERMGLALDLLSELAKERQIILFTCHDREVRYLEGKRKA
ncbi:MAG: ATP-binding protein [Oscillospiraceae bacterium]